VRRCHEIFHPRLIAADLAADLAAGAASATPLKRP
jgi:hypothetical protein